MNYCPLCKSELDKRHIDDIERLICSSDGCEYIFWDNPIPVVAAIVEHENRIILANNVNWPTNWYSLITGFLEKNETPEHGVIREVKEELNLEGVTSELVGMYSFARLNQLIIAYHVLAEGEIKLNEELREYKSISKEKLMPWRSETGFAVRDWLSSKGLYREEDGYFDREKK